MAKPRIPVLNRFAKEYLPNVLVAWKNMESWELADEEMNLINLNPKTPLDIKSTDVGDGLMYLPKKPIKFSDGEQYFFVLLHEIAHFKVKTKPPKEFLSIKDCLEKEYPGNLRMQLELADSYIKPRKNESAEDIAGRISNLRTWLSGLSASEHIMVEKWAEREFRKRRKEIMAMLFQ